MPTAAMLINRDTGDVFEFQFQPTGSRTGYSSVVVETPIRGNKSIADVSHHNPQGWTLTGEMVQDDETDDVERRFENLLSMWHYVDGTTRKPVAVLAGIGNKTYTGMVVSVAPVVFPGRLDDFGRPRRINFTVTFRVDDAETQGQGFGETSTRQIGVAR